MEALGTLIADSFLWLVTQLLEHKLSRVRVLAIMAPATFAGAVTGWILFPSIWSVAFLACAGFVISVGVMAVIAKKRELEREMEWTKTVEPPKYQDPFGDWHRHD